jgi:HAD superfamily hydrolase (TIGR01549 family)
VTHGSSRSIEALGMVRAIVWDFDGTLVDTRHRNLAVNRRIISEVSGHPSHRFPALASIDAYEAVVRANAGWREMYRKVFGLTQAQTETASSLWVPCQLAEETPAASFAGVASVVKSLTGVPQGIVSQNWGIIIRTLLEQERLLTPFSCIVGYDDLPPDRQKPAPDGLLTCLEGLGVVGPGRVLYIGDHPTDVECATYANERLAERGEAVSIVSVHAAYGCDGHRWDGLRPDHVASTPADILDIARGRS